MLTNGESGIDCINCGHDVIVKTVEDAAALSDKLTWTGPDPDCPGCGDPVTFEDYLE